MLKLRLANPTYGKAKLSVILKRDHGVVISESSVGRMLKDLVAKGEVKRPVSSLHIKRRRKFTSHAKKWEYGMTASAPGELIQIDHMTVTKHNITMREFRA